MGCLNRVRFGLNIAHYVRTLYISNMKRTGILYKLLPSLANVAITFVFALPFLYFYGFSLEWKLAWIGIFFGYNLFCEIVFGRCVGMMLCNTEYETCKSFLKNVLYVFLYTISFSTLLFYIWFPFDLLAINLFAIQLPCILLTGTTLHGLLSGATTVRENHP